MTSGKSILLAAILVAAAGGAYADEPQQAVPQTNQQLSYQAPQAPAQPTLHSRPEHYETPPGYYDDPKMVPYSRPGYGPKPN
jgi:nitrate reductase cytochrome c-type subunit